MKTFTIVFHCQEIIKLSMKTFAQLGYLKKSSVVENVFLK